MEHGARGVNYGTSIFRNSVDTASDLVLNDVDTQKEKNNNNEIYRKSVEKIIKKRWYLGIESDGYYLYLGEEKIGL